MNLLHHRGESYLLHQFVLMPDHFHLLISPCVALERAVQLIKGGFSHKAKKELGSNLEIWRRGFADHRVRDIEDFDRHLHYIHLNPVKKNLCEQPEQYRYSSAFPGWKLDPIPQGLKPFNLVDESGGTAKAVPFQSVNQLGGKDKDAFTENSAKSGNSNRISSIQSSPVIEVLKGHDFSRAERDQMTSGALAPKGIPQSFLPNSNGTGNHATQK